MTTSTLTPKPSTTPAPATGARALAAKLLATESDAGPMIARLALGAVMLPHGLQKLGLLGGDGIAATMGFMTGPLGIPAPFAALAIFTEVVGSLALLAGALSRAAALGIGAIMVVATLTVHLQHGFFMNWFGNQKGEGFEYHLLAAALAAVVVVKGGGKLALDRLLAPRLATS